MQVVMAQRLKACLPQAHRPSLWSRWRVVPEYSRKPPIQHPSTHSAVPAPVRSDNGGEQLFDAGTGESGEGHHRQVAVLREQGLDLGRPPGGGHGS